MTTPFDLAPDRRGSGSMKWDERPDALPLWVADMDFQTAPCVINALRLRVNHGVFGYTMVRPEYYKALQWWFARYHGLPIYKESVMYVPGVVPALSAIIKALVAPGNGVIVQTPVYNCFFSSIRNNGCRIVENPLRRVDLSESEFTYEMDFENLEAVASDPQNTMLLLCNPHNPAGRAWTGEELAQVSDICRRNGVTVVSDEIHCDLTMPGFDYVPYQLIDSEAIACLSPSKAFNTAGLQIANIICPDKEMRRKIDRAININEVCDVNPFGVEGLIAAYSPEGHEWLEQLRGYLYDNYLFLRDYVAENLPGVPVTKLEATYLPWLDINRFGIPSEALEEQILEHTGVWVNSGSMYGTDGFIRINIACTRANLEKGLHRICEYLKCRG
ncbi:MAG: pyridoxal phosphate-dependent aminotransferase [Muribaculaceae bacterium]|nr:pyridoxal phosphate-dependent aminotransferase [Muribaculaceae bacterium]